MSDKAPETRETAHGAAHDAHVHVARAHHARTRRRRRRRKAGLWSLLSMAVLVGAMALVALSYLGTPIVVPDWLRVRITDRINQQAGGLEVELGQMVVVIESGWTPHLALRRVTLRGHDGRVIATLGELGGTVALRPLLRGEVRPGSIRLSGLQVHLRRDDSGGVGVQLGSDLGVATDGPRPARDVPSLIAQIDTALGRPALASLTRVHADNMTLRYEDARSGRAWTVDGGKVSVTREDGVLNARGDFTVLGARAYASTLEFNFSSRIGSTDAQMGLNFSDLPAEELALQSPALAVLGALDAPISGALRATLDADGRLGPLNATLQIGQGVLQPTPATTPIAFEAARTYFTYDPVAQKIDIEALSIDSKWVTASIEGTAHLISSTTGWPDELQAQLRVSNITTNPADLYVTPVNLDSAALDMRLRLEPFHLSLGQLSLSDQGRHLVLNGEVRAADAGWDLALDGRMDGITRARLMQLWPEGAVPNTRRWVDENVEKGDLRNVELALRSAPRHKPKVALAFELSDISTRFMKTMPMIEGLSGKAALIGNRFAIEADTGRVEAPQGGLIDVSGTSFVVPDITIHQGPAEVGLHTLSSVTAALSLLDEEPFRFLTKQGRPVALAEGQARVEARLGFPLIKHLQTENVRYEAKGRLTDLRSDVLVPGRVLTAAALDVRLQEGHLQIGGDGRLDGVPFSGAWTAALGPEEAKGSRVEGTITLNQGFADAFGIGLPPGSLTGSAPAKVALDLGPEGTGEFTLTSDLAGLGLSLPQLNWTLARQARGALEVRGRLGEPPQIDRLSLDAPGLAAMGSVALKPGGQLGRALFSQVRVGGWLDAPVTLVGRGKGATPGVEVTGGSIDLRKANLTGGGAGAGGPISLALDRLVVSDALVLTGFNAALNTTRGVDGTFTGRVNGGTPVRGQIVPQAGRSAFRITTTDAGGVLGSAGILKQARGGEMELILTPAEAAGTYEGQLKGGNIWLTDAPALAALLSALSVVGLLEQMSGNGIHFSQVDARFRLGPERLMLYSGSAVGASMGISMDGYYYLGNKQMDMQGVISPLYAVNAIGALFTRRGEGLVGVNYTLRGSADAPMVEVNPLSLLTPGMFREIFRRPPPEAPTGAAPGGAVGGDSGQTAENPAQRPTETQRPPVRKPVDRGGRNRP